MGWTASRAVRPSRPPLPALGVTFFPQDFILLTLLLVIAALALFFFTALAGRLWCGYACPQTVWTEVYVWMERWTEGGSRRQARLDRGGWSAEKILRKSAKQAAWIAFSFLTGLTFVGYFSPIGPLVGARGHARAALVGAVLGGVLLIRDLWKMQATCASRCASTCAPTPASRARCSTGTR